MPANGRHIFCLDRKVTIMSETLCEAGQTSDSTIVALARESGINISTLKSACAKQQVTDKLSQKLSRACRFDLNHPSWVDVTIEERIRRKNGDKHTGADRPENFKKYLREIWGLRTSYSIRIKPSVPLVHDSMLAFFSIDSGGQSVDSDSYLPLFLTVDVEPKIEEEGFSYGFNALRIGLELPKDTNSLDINRFSLSDETTLIDAEFSKRGTDFIPFWILKSTNLALDGNYMTVESPMCEIKSLELGVKINAKLTANLRDASLVKVDGGPMPSNEKRAIIESLILNSIDDRAQDSGFLTLSSQSLEAVRVE